MTLLYYRPPQNIVAEKLQFIIESEMPDHQLEIFYSIEGLSKRLSQSARGNCAGAARSVRPHSSGRRLPLRVLQLEHAVTTLVQLLVPPREIGST